MPELKLNINKIPKTESNINTNKENNFDLEKSIEIKTKLEKTLANDMQDNAIDIEISEEDIKNANKRFNEIKIKKLGLYIVLLLTFVIFTGSAVYQVFFKHEFSEQEIANIANGYNGKTNFPESGVQGYLTENIDSLMSNNVIYETNSQEGDSITYSTPIVTYILARNDFISNVYFNVNITNKNGTSKLSCLLPIKYDFDNRKYAPAGNINLVMSSTAVDDVNEKSNPLFSFDGLKRLENTNDIKTFVTNFFNMLYEDQDITPYYKGSKLIRTEGASLLNVDDFCMYSSENIQGYNAICTLQLELPDKIKFKTIKYLNIQSMTDENGETSYFIKDIL